MDLSYGHEYDAFREEVKSFIRSNKHKQPKTGDGIKSQAMRDWQRLLIPRIMYTPDQRPNGSSCFVPLNQEYNIY